MRLEIHDAEDLMVLRALSVFIRDLADRREKELVEFDARLDAAVTQTSLIPLTEGDAPSQFDIKPGDTITVQGIPGSGVIQAGEAAAKPKRTRKKAEQLSLPLEPAAAEPELTTGAPEAAAAQDYTINPVVPAALIVRTPDVPQAPLAPAVAAASTASAPAANATPPIPPTPTTPSAPIAPQAPTALAAPPPPSTAPVVAPGFVGDTPKTFQELMRAISPALASKKLPVETLNEACVTVGVGTLQGLLQAPQYVSAVYAIVRGVL